MTAPQKQLELSGASWKQNTGFNYKEWTTFTCHPNYIHTRCNSLKGLFANVSKMKRDSITAFELEACLLLFIIQCIVTARQKRKVRCTDGEMLSVLPVN